MNRGRVPQILPPQGEVTRAENEMDNGTRGVVHEDRRKHVHVTCRCEPDEVSIAVKDEGKGFDTDNVPDPTAPQNIGSIHGRGIHMITALMDEVRFDEGGAVIHMKKRNVI
jgi:anti-sigma regulatory factor (Ser/Thr protein kinase)